MYFQGCSGLAVTRNDFCAYWNMIWQGLIFRFFESYKSIKRHCWVYYQEVEMSSTLCDNCKNCNKVAYTISHGAFQTFCTSKMTREYCPTITLFTRMQIKTAFDFLVVRFGHSKHNSSDQIWYNICIVGELQIEINLSSFKNRIPSLSYFLGGVEAVFGSLTLDATLYGWD